MLVYIGALSIIVDPTRSLRGSWEGPIIKGRSSLIITDNPKMGEKLFNRAFILRKTQNLENIFQKLSIKKLVNGKYFYYR